MRIYVTDRQLIHTLTNIKNYSVLSLLNVYPTNKENIIKIYSIDGIYFAMGDKLNRLDICDGIIQKTYINNMEFIVDNSTITYVSEWINLNPTHLVEHVTVYTYMLKQAVNLVIEQTHHPNDENKDNHSFELYFETNNPDFEDSISSFLTVLDLC